MKALIVSLFVVLFIVGETSGQQRPTLKEQVDGGISPDAWLNAERKRSGGKWNEVDQVSAPMAQILEFAVDAVGERTNQGLDCQRAAAIAGYEVLFDHYATVGLIGFEAAIEKAIGEIFKLYGAKMKEAVEGGKNALDDFKEKLKEGKKKIDEYLAEMKNKGKPEVFVSRQSDEGCTIVTLAIWDRTAESYEVIVYGDCKCGTRMNATERKTSKLGKFAIRVKGRVSVGVDYRKESPVLNVQIPTEVTVDANCDACEPGGGRTTPPVTPPVDNVDPCTLKPPCPQCAPIVDKIKAACERLKVIGLEIIKKNDVYRGVKDQRDYAVGELNRLKSGNADPERIRRKETEVARRNREVRSAKFRVDGLGFEELELKASLKRLKAELRQCQKDKCGSSTIKPVVLPPNARMDPCLIGRWRSEYFEQAFDGTWSGSGVLLSFDGAGTMTVDYSQMTAMCPGGDCKALRVWYTGQASAKINLVNGNIWPERRQSSVKHLISHDGNTPSESERIDGGPGFLQSDTSYSCDAFTLTTVQGTASDSKKLFRRL